MEESDETSHTSALKYMAMNEALSFRNRVVAVDAILQRALRFDEKETIDALVRIAGMSCSSNHDSRLIAGEAVRKLEYIKLEGSGGDGSMHLCIRANVALRNLRRD